MCPLGGSPDVDSTGAVRNGQPRLGPQRGLILDPHLVASFHHHLAVTVLVAVTDSDRPEDRPLLERGLEIGDGGQVLEFEIYRLGGPPRLLPCLGGHHRHRLTPMADLGFGEHRLVGDDLALIAVTGHVVDGDDVDHPRHGPRRSRVEADDAGVSRVCSTRHGPQHPVRMEVVDILEGPRDLGDAVRPEHRLAHPARHLSPLADRCGHGISSRSAATEATALSTEPYPVHRQMLPDSASRMSSIEGLAACSSR